MANRMSLEVLVTVAGIPDGVDELSADSPLDRASLA